jgi:hypothetical protein
MVRSESACVKTRGRSLIFARAWLEHGQDSQFDVGGISGEIKRVLVHLNSAQRSQAEPK